MEELVKRLIKYGPQPPIYSAGAKILPFYWDRNNNVLAWKEFKKLGSIDRNIIIKFPAKSTVNQLRNWISKIKKYYKTFREVYGSKTAENPSEILRNPSLQHLKKLV